VLRWGVLGTARIAAQQVIPAIKKASNGDVVAVSSSSGRAAPYAERLGIPVAHNSHEALLADPDVDAVYIPLPNSMHVEWTVKAAEAGKHVLCEKPVALDPAGLAEAEAACDARGVHLAEAFMYRHHPQIAVVRDLIANGRIGDLVAIDARFHFLLDRSAGPNIRLDPDLGGGALRDVGCYPVDLMNLLAGAAPDEVVATSIERGDVDTTTAGYLRYGDVVGTFSCGFDSPAGDSALVIGSAGTIGIRRPFRPDRGGAVLVVTGADGRTETIEPEGDAYVAEVEDFARRVLDRDPDTQGRRLSRWTLETTTRLLE
jgi:D-xylose 1-dehydrogenase (NADP+, D-xylono-1,5-lactone-forming)